MLPALVLSSELETIAANGSLLLQVTGRYYLIMILHLATAGAVTVMWFSSPDE